MMSRKKPQKPKKQTVAKRGQNGKRGQNFSPLEDTSIARTWIRKLENAIKGTDQKGDVFWSGVHKMYLKLLEDHRKVLP